MYVYIYIYDYMYACVCVCEYLMANSLALFVDHSAVFSAFNVFRMSLVLVWCIEVMILCVLTQGSKLKLFSALVLVSPFPMQRQDPLKIFLGCLSPTVNKPQLQGLFEGLCLEPVEIIVPQCIPGKMAVAFVTFISPEQATAAVELLNGCTESGVSPARITALIGVLLMGVFISPSGKAMC